MASETPDKGKAAASNILQSFLKMAETIMRQPEQTVEEKKKVKRCPGCRCSLEELQEDGKFNCLKCYECFGDDLLSGFEAKKETKKVKKKKRVSYEDCVARLEQGMKAAVKKENYEHAALIRDALKEVSKINASHQELNDKLVAAIKAENFDEAAQIQKEMEQLIKQCALIQKRFQE